MPIDEFGKDTDSGDMGLGEEAEPTEPLDEFGTEVSSAFPAEEWTPSRLMALKEAIKLCVESDKAGEYDDGPPKKGGDTGLALIFGGPKKKAG
jgi:hypothetical protein